MDTVVMSLHYEYEQGSGRLFVCDCEDGRVLVGRGYSGRDHGLNNPDAEHLPGIGPIPRGIWNIAPAISHPTLGPVAMHLRRVKIPHGRSAFLIHGDNPRGDQSASRGCIILPRPVRDFISRSGIRALKVVA